MGCETSREENNEIVSISTNEQFKLSYRELVTQDRGHIFELYQFSTILNRSNHSIVRKVISRASQQARVCKIIPLHDKKYFSVISQIEFMKKMDHPNIIQIIQYFLEPSFLYIVLEYVPGDRILRELNKIKEGILFTDVVEIMRQLLRAVDFCHRKSIAHRAITTENVLLFFSDSQPCLKLIDFSQACTIGCTNPSSIPAEKRNVILKETQSAETDKIDIYDCGIVFYTLLSGKRYICNDVQINYKKMLDNSFSVIKQANLSKKVQKDLIDLFSCMLAQNPKQRLSALQCLNHSFFKNFQKNISSKKALENLMRFQPDNNLKYLLSMYASINMTSAIEKAEHLSEFYNLDTNKDGEIQLEELIQGIQNTFDFDYEKSKKYAQQMFQNLDKNKSGSINFSQYITGTIQLSRLISNNFLQKMFNELDINHDGYITEYEVNNLILGIDRYNVLDGEKKVDLKTFKKMMLKMLEKEKCLNLE